MFYAWGSKRQHPAGKGVTSVWTLILGLDCTSLAKSSRKVDYLTGLSQTDADEIAVATDQISAVSAYTFYNSGWSQDGLYICPVRSRYIAVISLRITHERHPKLARKSELWEVVTGCKSDQGPKFYHCYCCAVWIIVSYITVIYRECIL